MGERKQRAIYTVQDDVLALREVLSTSGFSGVFSHGSANSKLHHWAEIAKRLSMPDAEMTGEGLRRRISDLAKKQKADEGSEPVERMRWGMPWPKSDEEVERDKLIKEYKARLLAAKNQPVVAKKQPTKHPHPAPRTNATTAPVVAAPVNAPILANVRAVVDVQQILPVSRVENPQTLPQKRKNHPVVVIDGEEPTGSYEPSRRTQRPMQVEADSRDISRRRLEIEERVQNRMLDIQSEQIALQREQLRMQTEVMRSMAESTQAIARALHALEQCSMQL